MNESANAVITVVFVTGLVVHLLIAFGKRKPPRAARITHRVGHPPT